MHSKYLGSLTEDDRNDLTKSLHDSQGKKCFICDKPIDLEIHRKTIEIDHIESLQAGGKDSPDNFALTHSSCNESKQASNLRVARLLARFDKIKEKAESGGRESATLHDVLNEFGASKDPFHFSINNSKIRYSFSEIGDNSIHESSLYVDELNGLRYFFAEMPIQYMFHDSEINPRGIGSNLRKLIEEFHKGRPQLHITLGRINSDSPNEGQLLIFDGQHKAAAQILLGATKLPTRIFLNPNVDVLLTTNTNAGDTLRQVAFDKSIKRRLNHSLYRERIERYQKEHNLSDDDLTFSEKDLVDYFRGEYREIKKFITDSIRDGVTHDKENALITFVDFGGRAKENPLSYSAVDKTFYSFFVYTGVLSLPLNYKADIGENPRELERIQLVRLMNIIAEEIYLNKFKSEKGVYRIETRLQEGEDIPEPHLTAVRMSKEEVLYNWLKYIRTIIMNYFVNLGKHMDEEKLFQEPFPDQLWANIRNFLKNLRSLPLWINKELSTTIFGVKHNYDYWEYIFKEGITPSGQKVMTSGLNILHMIKS